MASLTVQRYEPKHKVLWDRFIERSKNGVFLFDRDYMGYHADRFEDHSLLFLEDGELVAVLPANVTEGLLVSHGGLTFGGVVSDHRMKTPLMLELFQAMREHLVGRGIGRMIYKPSPHIYHRMPAEEDLYALFRNNASLIRRDVASTICLTERLDFNKGRRWGIRRARSSGATVRRSDDFATFMAIEEAALLARHGVSPVHTAEELALLASRFPDQIKLFGAYKDETMIAGVVMYEHATVVHAQYIAANETGRRLGAVDAIMNVLISDCAPGTRYFDFGISTERDGRYLNVGLVENKEGFGARAVVYDFYEMGLG